MICKTGTDFWHKAVEKEMKACGIAFEFRNDQPVGFAEITCHLVFDTKMDFTRKARHVAGGHLTDPPDNVPACASVVSRESMRILFLAAALYDVDVLAADVGKCFFECQVR